MPKQFVKRGSVALARCPSFPVLILLSYELFKSFYSPRLKAATATDVRCCPGYGKKSYCLACGGGAHGCDGQGSVRRCPRCGDDEGRMRCCPGCCNFWLCPPCGEISCCLRCDGVSCCLGCGDVWFCPACGELCFCLGCGGVRSCSGCGDVWFSLDLELRGAALDVVI